MIIAPPSIIDHRSITVGLMFGLEGGYQLRDNVPVQESCIHCTFYSFQTAVTNSTDSEKGHSSVPIYGLHSTSYAQ
jgi:hypothetical protein